MKTFIHSINGRPEDYILVGDLLKEPDYSIAGYDLIYVKTSLAHNETYVNKLAQKLNKRRCEGARLYLVPECFIYIRDEHYSLMVFETLWG